MRFPRLLPSRFVSLLAVASATLTLGFAAGGCEKHPAGEPAEGYGHGSARPGSKGGDKHRPDGSNTRFSDSQGTDIRAPHKEAGESETHASGPEHGRPGPGGEKDSEHKEP